MPDIILPAAVVDALKVVVGRQIVAQFTVAAVSTVFLVEDTKNDEALDIGRIQLPGANNGAAYTGLTWIKSRSGGHKLVTREIKKVITFLGSLADKKDGTLRLFIRDPRDTGHIVALVSQDYACSIYRDPAEVAFSPAGETMVTLIAESLQDGPITWQQDLVTVDPT